MMKLEYKNLFLLHIFTDAVACAIFLKHDVYQVCLAIASLMAAYAITSFITKNRLRRVILFVLMSVVFCQVSITMKMNQLNDSNPTGAIAADIVHGFKRIFDLRHVPGHIKEKGLSVFLETANYRYSTMTVLTPLMIIPLVRGKLSDQKERRLKGKKV
jgi:hypothetical protein